MLNRLTAFGVNKADVTLRGKTVPQGSRRVFFRSKPGRSIVVYNKAEMTGQDVIGAKVTRGCGGPGPQLEKVSLLAERTF